MAERAPQAPERRSDRFHSVAPRAGPLVGIRVIELGVIGPGPFCGMVLSGMGADVIRVE